LELGLMLVREIPELEILGGPDPLAERAQLGMSESRSFSRDRFDERSIPGVEVVVRELDGLVDHFVRHRAVGVEREGWMRGVDLLVHRGSPVGSTAASSSMISLRNLRAFVVRVPSAAPSA